MYLSSSVIGVMASLIGLKKSSLRVSFTWSSKSKPKFLRGNNNSCLRAPTTPPSRLPLASASPNIASLNFSVVVRRPPAPPTNAPPISPRGPPNANAPAAAPIPILGSALLILFRFSGDSRLPSPNNTSCAY